MTLWAEVMSLGFTAQATLLVRLLMVPLILYNLGWTFRGFVELLKGIPYPTSIYQSVVFLMSSGLLGFHILAFMGRSSPSWNSAALAMQCLFLLACILALVGRRIAISMNFERYYWLFETNNLDVAIRMGKINQLDPKFASATLESAETTLAIRLARKATGRD